LNDAIKWFNASQRCDPSWQRLLLSLCLDLLLLPLVLPQTNPSSNCQKHQQCQGPPAPQRAATG
jgi:hypothetical protein